MASRSESPLAAGHKLDRYELLCPVGEGGMASVWVARLTRKHGFEKLVAIKTILPKFAEDETFQKMFLDEARIASRIEHANVVHIHDLGEESQILYIVMDWLDGEALTRLRKAIVKAEHAFPLGIALRIMADVCAGLHAAHELKNSDGTSLGVVHRDVSPQNVLITVEGVSKLIDFGVAKAAHRLVDETSAGFVKGKVQYMAPEQALGKVVDRRADVWAAGAVLYHLLANRPPFEADNQLAMLHELTRGAPPPALPASIPPAVTAIVHRALTHDLTRRFQTASEMRSAIERTGLAATTEDVATCLRTYLGARAQARRDALAAALRTANARAEEESRKRASSSGISGPDASAPNASAPNLADVKETQRLDPSFRPAFLTPHASDMTPPQQAWRTPPGTLATPDRSFSTSTSTSTSNDRASRSDIAPYAPGRVGPGAFALPNPSSSDLRSVASSIPFDRTDTATTPSLASSAHEPVTAGSLGSASISAPIATLRRDFRRGVVLGFVAVVSVIGVAAVLVGLNFERFRSNVSAAPTFSPTFSPLPPPAATSTFAPNAATTEPDPSPTLAPGTSPTGTAPPPRPATSANVSTSQSAPPARKPADGSLHNSAPLR